MKLASLKRGGPDGTLIAVSRDLSKAIGPVQAKVNTLQAALEQWSAVAPVLESVYQDLNAGKGDLFELEVEALAAPLPRSYQWLDGSAYLTHVERVRKARGAPMPPNYETEPLMYQGNSSAFLAPRDPIRGDIEWGIDFEAEVAVITDEVPMGITPAGAKAHIKLIMLVNDISYRNLIPPELAKGFGFLHGKPGCAFSPVTVTPDELGEHWDGHRLHLPLTTRCNGTVFGRPNAGDDMHFDFPSLISHAARTRCLPAGTIIGSGTVSNADPTRGYSCIVEQRMQEIVHTGRADTGYLQDGDRVRIEMQDTRGQSIFGAIDHVLQHWPR